jgi:hypothetical protein
LWAILSDFSCPPNNPQKIIYILHFFAVGIKTKIAVNMQFTAIFYFTHCHLAEAGGNEPHLSINSLSEFYFKSYHRGNDLVMSSKDALLSSPGQKWPQMTWDKGTTCF